MSTIGDENAERGAHPEPSAAAWPAASKRRRLLQLLQRYVLPTVSTAVIFFIIFQRIPLQGLRTALEAADYGPFLLLMVPNTILYFCWDTLVLTMAIRWFHGPIRYVDLLAPRAASYVLAVFNTNLARGALAAYLARRLKSPFLHLGSTVLFLLVAEYAHLVAWASVGMLIGYRQMPVHLFWVPPVVAVGWLALLFYSRRRVMIPRAARWGLFRTFTQADPRRYVSIVLLRAPMFFASLCFHYFAAHAFGIHIPFVQLLAFLPVIFMLAALPISVAHVGTTQAAWVLFFSPYAPPERLLAFSLSAHVTFSFTRAILGVLFVPRAYAELSVGGLSPAVPRTSRGALLGS